ncbi:MAG: hypothetical protein KUG83_04245 [Gammaproteobacteria bacterium]|nr:hypothetical protein [Gammaproteobacteria bacterium]
MVSEQVKSILKYAPTILIVGFVLATSYSLSRMTWLLVEGDGAVAQAISTSRAPLKPATVESFYGRELAGWGLFGALKAEKKTSSSKVQVKAPDTRLQLTLKGVYVAPIEAQSSAIIADKRNAKRYLLGEKIPGGVTLHEVQSQLVILKRGMKYETLRFSEPNLKAIKKSKPRVSSMPRRRPSSANRGIVKDIRSGKINSVQDVLNDYGANPAEQFAAVLLEAGMEPTQDGGEAGLKVGASAPKDILKTVGLRPGDIVRSVNGFPVNELEGDDALLREILTSAHAKIVIQRGSRRFTVNYPLPQG